MEAVRTVDLVYEYTEVDEKGDERVVSKAIDHVDLGIERGDFIAILGRNGSGKSTLARHINALLRPTNGTVYVSGMDTKEEDKLLSIRMSAGMVFQNPDNQIIAGVVEEDVAFGLENLGIDPEKMQVTVDESLADMGMSAYAHHSPNRLSGGQKQRVAIAGVLAMRPDTIVFDEPTAMLDPAGREEVLRAAQKLNKEHGVTIILITHYVEEAALADRAIVMDGGKIVMDGRPAEIFDEAERLEGLGLTVPRAAKMAADLRKQGLPIAKGITDINGLAEEIIRIYGSK